MTKIVQVLREGRHADAPNKIAYYVELENGKKCWAIERGNVCDCLNSFDQSKINDIKNIPEQKRASHPIVGRIVNS